LKRTVESIERSSTVAREATSSAAQAQVDAARALIEDGLTLRDAAIVLHVSHQRVAQLVAKSD
jgi:hypothetical protein